MTDTLDYSMLEHLLIKSPSVPALGPSVFGGAVLPHGATLLGRPAMQVSWQHMRPVIAPSTETSINMMVSVSGLLDYAPTVNEAIASRFAEAIGEGGRVAGTWVEAYEPLRISVACQEPTLDAELKIRRAFTDVIRELSPYDLSVGVLSIYDAATFVAPADFAQIS